MTLEEDRHLHHHLSSLKLRESSSRCSDTDFVLMVDEYDATKKSRRKRRNKKKGSKERKAEGWLARTSPDIYTQWNNPVDCDDSTTTQSSTTAGDDTCASTHNIENSQEITAPSDVAQSTLSSPGRFTIREKLRRKLFKPKRRASSPSELAAPVPSPIVTDLRTPSVLRMSVRRYGRQGSIPKGNVIRLHIYDLLSNDTIMQLPWGCDFPIGKCFVAMNNGLNALGTGAYHCGIEINGVEYAYGANEISGSTGVFTCIPMRSPGYEYRTTIDFGARRLCKDSWEKNADDTYRSVQRSVEGREVMRRMAREYMGTDYDLLRKNCCTFAKDACLRLGVQENEIPNWFMNLAGAGAKTQELAVKTLQVLSTPPTITRRSPAPKRLEPPCTEHLGYEVIHQDEFVTIVEARGQSQEGIGVRRSMSWTY